MRKSKYAAMVIKKVDDPENDIHIDVNQIPEYVKNELADWAIRMTKEVLSRPGEMEKYQRWLAEREAKQAAERSAT